MAMPASTKELLESVGPRMQVDIACWSQGRLLIYGWILNFATDVVSARLQALDLTFDLKTLSLRIPRPDVSQHFRRQMSSGSTEHGFFVLLELPDRPELTAELRFEIASHAGPSIERLLLVERQDEPAGVALKPYLDTLHALLRHLPASEAQRLIDFAGPALAPARAPPETLDPPMRFTIDLCCVLQERILIVAGWMLDPLQQLSSIKLRFEASIFELRESMVRVPRPDLATLLEPYRGLESAVAPGFVFAVLVPAPTTPEGTATFLLTSEAGTVTLTQKSMNLRHEALGEFTSWHTQANPDAALSISTLVTGLLTGSAADQNLRALLELQNGQAVARLPTSLQSAQPRYTLMVDHAVAVADRGIFLIGWFAAAPTVNASMTLLCHAGDVSFDLGANWTRCGRQDVLAHLVQLGISSYQHDHGYICFVPLASALGPYSISLAVGDGVPARMRVAVAPASETALPTIRAILTTFNARHPQLLMLMQQQIGPAVGAAWSARVRPASSPRVERFGQTPASVETSVIVPLYGRHDFAEYQLAQFADDPDFQRLELIYVVDDPSIHEEFRSLCDGLFNMYGVPFTVVFPGENLGFAGANNCAARLARGGHLLLMNSDVFPKRPGWVGAMLRTYKKQRDAGILGVKLLFENGGVQHAGMEFRRFAAWSGLWTNYHPFKGQSAAGLSGVREVHAVTAACVLVESELYRKLGGLSEDYVIGDFEDSDLCLRAIAAQRRNYLDLDIELYHLERQSQNRVGDDVFRSNLTLYNCWLHHQRWSTTIEALQP